MEKTGTWIWPKRYADLKVLEVTEDDLSIIKSLIVGWDVSELGAPALVTREGEWLYEAFEQQSRLESLLSLFFNQAILDENSTFYNNPLVSNGIEQSVIDEAIYGIPDKTLKDKLTKVKIIEIEQIEILNNLWNSCDIRPSGFDPKRGFQLANLQEIIDPEKLLSKTEISKQRKFYKSQLFLYLQLFIKEAKLETGFYHSYDHYNWIKGKDYGYAEEYTRHDWLISFNSDYYTAIDNFVELMEILPKLVKLLSAKRSIDYANIVEVFNLDTLFIYDNDNVNRANITLEEILLKALDYFPEEKGVSSNLEGYPFLLLLVRLYNAQGRFEEAQKLLQENNLDIFTEKQLEFFCTLPNKYQQIAFYESCICKMVNTGNFDLWRFPEYPKFTKEEIETFDIYTGAFFLDDPEQKKKYEAEQKKIEKLLKARGKLVFDMRTYLDISYFNNLNSIYNDLKNKNLHQSLDGIIVSIVGQINLLMELCNNK